MGPIIPLFEKRQNVYALKKFSDTKIQLLSVKPWDLKFSAPSTRKVFEDCKYGGLNIELTQYDIYINIRDRYQPVLRYYPDPSDESGNFWVDPVNSLLEFDNATLTAVGRVIINIVELDDHDMMEVVMVATKMIMMMVMVATKMIMAVMSELEWAHHFWQPSPSHLNTILPFRFAVQCNLMHSDAQCLKEEAVQLSYQAYNNPWHLPEHRPTNL